MPGIEIPAKGCRHEVRLRGLGRWQGEECVSCWHFGLGLAREAGEHLPTGLIPDEDVRAYIVERARQDAREGKVFRLGRSDLERLCADHHRRAE